MFATWKLRQINDNEFDGPDSAAAANGEILTPITTNGSPETGGLILGKYDTITTDLSAWNFKTITKTAAEKFIKDNFKPVPLPDGTISTLEMNLAALVDGAA